MHPQSITDRFWSKVDRSGDCWLWTAARTPAGYGEMHAYGTTVLAHSLSWEIATGQPAPMMASGLTLDHLCRVRHCVRPSHLEVVRRGVNVLRGVGFAAVNATKTHCPAGHPYDATNTTRRSLTGWRSCRACNRARYHARHQEQVQHSMSIAP